MVYNSLGTSGINVSSLCFGSLTMTPSQGNLTIDEGAELICYAYKKGVNFIDTADLYNNYAYIKKALESIGRKNMVIATKSYAYDEETAKESLARALEGLATDYIDIFLLHEQESIHTIRGHSQALDYFRKMKDQGIIRALGISTHKVEGARGFNQVDYLDILHPMINYKGLGILDGTREDMLEQIRIAQARGKGVYGMKILGGGHLIPEIEEAFGFARSIGLDSVALGMQSKEEVDCNISLLRGDSYPSKLKAKLRSQPRKLKVADYCIGCGKCVDMCRHQGIELVNGQARPTSRCILCGYCANYCPDFCIKVV